MTTVRSGQPWFYDRQGNEFFFFTMSKPALGPVMSSTQWVTVFFLQCKAAGARSSYSLPPGAEAENKRVCVSTVLVSFHGVDRVIFSYT